MKNRIFTLSAMCAMIMAANAETLDFTYNYEDADPSGYGKGKAETVDVAIRLANPGLVGKKIVSLSVPVFGEASDLTDLQGFLTSELKTKTQNKVKVNDPDICVSDGTLTDGTLNVTFAEPYTITEGGVYVGYSVTVTTGLDGAAGKPAAVVYGDVADSFWFHSTSSVQKWSDYAARYGMISDMTVVLEGDFLKDAVSLTIPNNVYAGLNSETLAEVVLTNQGISEIRSISYSYEAMGIKGNADLELPQPMPGKLGYPMVVTVPVGTYDALGAGELAITIDKVNGNSNETTASASASFEVIPFVPKNRPLVEEYTGLGCGYCPRGYVTLAEMGEKYGHDFVALSYHSAAYESTEAMVYLSTSEFPYNPSGYPASQVNRTASPGVEDIPKTWSTLRADIPCADVEVELDWADESKTQLKATSKTRFINDIEDSPYLITFALVADGLSNPAWGQYNAYSFDDANVDGLTGKWWDLFVHTKSYVFGLVFDDVVLQFKDVKGISGSLPSSIKQGEVYENEFTVETDKVLNLGGLDVVNDWGLARVVAVIINKKTGAVINSASSGYPGQSGVKEIAGSDASVIATEYFDLAGRRVMNPVKGLFIKAERLSDGTLRTTKIAR